MFLTSSSSSSSSASLTSHRVSGERERGRKFSDDVMDCSLCCCLSRARRSTSVVRLLIVREPADFRPDRNHRMGGGNTGNGNPSVRRRLNNASHSYFLLFCYSALNFTSLPPDRILSLDFLICPSWQASEVPASSAPAAVPP